MPPTSAIRLHQVSKRYELFAHPIDRLKRLLFRREANEDNSFWALRDLDLEIGAGEVVGVIGRNGAGKSTLLQLVCGTLSPSAGTVEVNGRIAALLELGAGFNPDFTGRENVYLNAAILGLSRDEIDARFDQIASFADIGDFLERPVKTYSSGMYVRLAFSVAIHVDPQILIVDEALSVGDGLFARKSFERIMQLKDAGKTILFCSHSMYQVEALCNRAIWLEQGKLMQSGKPAEVVAAYTDFQRRQEAANEPASPELLTPLQTEPGTGRLLSVQVATADRNLVSQTDLVSGMSDLTIRVEYLSDPALPPPSVALAIMTEDRRPVSASSSTNDHVTLTRDTSGRGAVSLHYPNLPLLKGRYMVDAWLLDETGLHAYDAAQGAIALNVSQHGLEQGLVALPHRWESE
jgi:lipopolysaccharide transport system ATP-binding protein